MFDSVFVGVEQVWICESLCPHLFVCVSNVSDVKGK